MPGPFEYVKTWGRWPSMGRATRQAVGIFQFSFLRLVPGAQEGSRCAKVGIFESGIVHNGTCLFHSR